MRWRTWIILEAQLQRCAVLWTQRWTQFQSLPLHITARRSKAVQLSLKCAALKKFKLQLLTGGRRRNALRFTVWRSPRIRNRKRQSQVSVVLKAICYGPLPLLPREPGNRSGRPVVTRHSNPSANHFPSDRLTVYTPGVHLCLCRAAANKSRFGSAGSVVTSGSRRTIRSRCAAQNARVLTGIA